MRTGMFEVGKIHNTIRKMRRLKVDILEISEMPYYSKKDQQNH